MSGSVSPFRLEMRVRVAGKIQSILTAEFGDPFDALEAMHVLGLAAGFGLASAPTEAQRQEARAELEKGIHQAEALRAALGTVR